MYKFHFQICFFFYWIFEIRVVFAETHYFIQMFTTQRSCPIYYQMHNTGLLIYMHVNTLAPKGACPSSRVRNASMDRRWQPYWLMKYIKILGHNCKCLKHCSIYEQHSVICVQVIYKNMNIYHMGDKCCLTESPYPKFDNSAQYYIHIWFMK